MKRFLTSIIVLMLAVAADAQSPVGKRDYFHSDGAAVLSANTLSHYSLSRKSNFYVDLYNELTVPVPADAVVVKTLVGTSNYKSDTATRVIENVFVFSVLDGGKWKNYLPVSYVVLNDSNKPLKKQYIMLSWETGEFDVTFPAKATVLLKELNVATGKKTEATKLTDITYSRTSVSFKLSSEETSLTSVSFFTDKVLKKQNDKSKKMIDKFNSSSRDRDEEVLSNHYLGVRP